MRLASLALVLPVLAVASAQQTPFAAPQVYLYPSPSSSSSSSSTLPPSLTPEQASSVLAHHLGETRHAFLPETLDGLERWAGLMWDEVKAVAGVGGGSGAKGRVLVVQGVQDPSDFITEEPTFTLDEAFPSAIDELLAPFLHRASEFFANLVQYVDSVHVPNFLLDIFDLSSDDVSKTVKQQLTALSSWADDLAPASSSGSSSVEALNVDSLALLPPKTEQYKAASSVIKGSISSLSAGQEPFILILTPPSSTTHLARRQAAAAAPSGSSVPAKQVGDGPVWSVDSCFTTADACSNGTASCSGRGECVGTKRAGRSCFSCACGTTNEKDGQTQWAGARCEKKDVSSSFALILFTLVLLVFVAGGSIALLSSAGNAPLPSVLAAGSGGAHKRD